MMGKAAVCHVCEEFDVNARGRELEQVRTQCPPAMSVTDIQSR